MLVVSNIDLEADVPSMKPSRFIKSTVKDFILNINNDYRYMKTGYYVSLYAEVLGDKVIPATRDIIDAYRVPVLLLRAMKAGVTVPPHIVTGSVKHITSEFSFPVVVFAVNPFSSNGFRVANNRSALYRAVKSLSMNYKYAVCAQPLMGPIATYKAFFGKCWTGDRHVEEISRKVYETFKIPLCKLHIQHVNGEAYLCGLQHLSLDEISMQDIGKISHEIGKLFREGGFD
ncbi:MAG: RimK-like ATPgrasp N-terminal domain-containing protein [Candidatus Bathyarchaeota archaeon]|nr:RimK-like ATPgrasp N-terminal domain-containing protein [Candidatus Bathyarchaeota archaeon]